MQVPFSHSLRFFAILIIRGTPLFASVERPIPIPLSVQIFPGLLHVLQGGLLDLCGCMDVYGAI